MRRVCYSVASSLDGFIAGPHGEYDWIVMDPDIDFNQMFARFDTIVMGRKTYEASLKMGGGGGGMKGITSYVFSTTLKEPKKPDKNLAISDNPREVISRLQQQPGKDIWLFGGGSLFKSLLELELVDAVETAVMPVLLGGGIPLLPTPAARAALTLTGHRVFDKTGTVALEYAVKKPGGPSRT